MSRWHVENFLEANKQSPVVYGSVIDPELPTPRGCFYRLQNGQTFTLSAADCALVGYPRWRHAAAA